MDVQGGETTDMLMTFQMELARNLSGESVDQALHANSRLILNAQLYDGKLHCRLANSITPLSSHIT